MTVNSSRKRFFKLAKMTVSLSSQAVRYKIKSIAKDEEYKESERKQLLQQVGEQIFITLGEMKGAAMKFGQVAAQYQSIFPSEIREQMLKLQTKSEFIDFAIVKKQIEKELKKELEELFQNIDGEPFAAASMGQVHRATLKDGRKVVIKVQYPNMDEICRSDLKLLKKAISFTGLAKIDRQLQQSIFREIENSLLQEINYEIEAQHLKIFSAFHQHIDAKIIIPQVIEEYSTPRLLVLSEELGENIETASHWELEIRNELGRRLMTAIRDEMFGLGIFHCDPHAGNFAFRRDGSVIMYDFGAVKTFSQAVIDDIKHLLNAANSRDLVALEQALMRVGILQKQNVFPTELYLKWLEVLLRPLVTHYDFAENSSHSDARKLLQPSLKYWDLFKPSAETLLMSRTISGHYWNLVQLGVKDDFSDFWEEML